VLAFANRIITISAKSPYADTTVPHVPANPEDIMAALLRTPPLPPGDKSTRTTIRKRTRKRR
jgi:hypothetical protein